MSTTKYLFFNKLTLELVGVLESLTVDLDGGTVCLTQVTQAIFIQPGDLWDLVFITSKRRQMTSVEDERLELSLHDHMSPRISS